MSIELEGYSTLRNDANLVHYMRMESATATVGSNMTNVNSVTFSAAQFNNGGVFSRASDTALYLGSDLGITNGAITFIGWVKFTAQPADGDLWPIFDKTDGGVFVRYGLYYTSSGGTKRLQCRRDRAGVADGGYTVDQTLSNDTWYQVAYTYDTTNVQGYVNGSAVGTATAASGNGSASAVDAYVLGARANDDGAGDGVNHSHDMTGLIDDAAVFSRALTSTEISDFYNASSSAIKTINGLAKASVKTVDGLAIASVKTWNGLA